MFLDITQSPNNLQKAIWTIRYEISETNSSFRVKERSAGKV